MTQIKRPAWLRPWMLASGIGLIAALGVLNFAAALYGSTLPWLAATDIVVDIAVLGAGLYLVLCLALRAEAQSAKLDASQARLAAIVGSAMDAIITVDDEQKIVLFNRAAEQVFRCRREDALGATLDRFIPARFRAAHGEHLAKFGRVGATARRMGDNTTLWALRADGEEFPIEASISHATEGERHYFTVILRDITPRKRNEDALARQQAELRELSAQVQEAREEEKTRIARELHDELGQLLTAMKMDMAWLRARLPQADAQLTAKAGEIGALLDRTVTSTRRIAADLRPLMLDDLGLADAAGWLAEESSRHSGVKVELQLQADEGAEGLDRGVATAVYRALQESLTNVAKHAGAKNAWVVMGIAPPAVYFEIEDDGRGISPGDLAKSRSLGLKGMRERVQYLGGSLEVTRAPRGGTRVRVSVPFRTAAEAAP
ncbi:MAG: PAS domain S-box protein [Burkholderiales bacterium]